MLCRVLRALSSDASITIIFKMSSRLTAPPTDSHTRQVLALISPGIYHLDRGGTVISLKCHFPPAKCSYKERTSGGMERPISPARSSMCPLNVCACESIHWYACVSSPSMGVFIMYVLRYSGHVDAWVGGVDRELIRESVTGVHANHTDSIYYLPNAGSCMHSGTHFFEDTLLPRKTCLFWSRKECPR